MFSSFSAIKAKLHGKENNICKSTDAHCFNAHSFPFVCVRVRCERKMNPFRVVGGSQGFDIAEKLTRYVVMYTSHNDITTFVSPIMSAELKRKVSDPSEDESSGKKAKAPTYSSSSSAAAASELQYLAGFGQEHASEALPDALPKTQNNPQRYVSKSNWVVCSLLLLFLRMT